MAWRAERRVPRACPAYRQISVPSLYARRAAWRISDGVAWRIARVARHQGNMARNRPSDNIMANGERRGISLISSIVDAAQHHGVA
jgi:hypothetical protein